MDLSRPGRLRLGRGLFDGFKKAVAGHKNISIVTEKFGDSGVAVQPGLCRTRCRRFPT